MQVWRHLVDGLMEKELSEDDAKSIVTFFWGGAQGRVFIHRASHEVDSLDDGVLETIEEHLGHAALIWFDEVSPDNPARVRFL